MTLSYLRLLFGYQDPFTIIPSESARQAERAAKVARRRQALAEMEALREQAIAKGMELWSVERIKREIAGARGETNE
jgi:uncharacterized membrane protein YccC